MTELQVFIEQARAKGLSDDEIRSVLKNQGWDESRVTMALQGLDVPMPSPASPTQPSEPPKHPSISHLMAALHHVLLWFFTGSSAVTIAGVVASLFGADISPEALASMIAVTLITFTPYAILFIIYLRQAKRTPGLIPGRVWSIITICLHSVGAMVAAITLVVSLITSGDPAIITSAAFILGLDLLVVTIYSLVAFGSPKLARVRKVVTYIYLPLLAILFGGLSVLSFMQLGPAQHDTQLRKDLVATVKNIAEYTVQHQQLPDELGSLQVGQGIEYNKKTSRTYEVCTTFSRASKDQSYYTTGVNDDNYTSEAYFYPSHSGQTCFQFQSAALPAETQSDTTTP